MTPFNLLHYPALASQRRRVHRRWTSLAGLLVGAAVASWSVQAVQEAAERLQLERIRLQAQWTDQNLQRQQLEKQQAAQKTWQQQSSHLNQLSRQHSTWLALHQTLQQEAGPGSVQFVRLQLEAQKLELHGQASDLKRMESARKRFAQNLSQWPTTTPSPLPLGSAGANKRAGNTSQPFWIVSSLVAIPSISAAKTAQRAGQPATHQPGLAFVWQSHGPLWGEGAP